MEIYGVVLLAIGVAMDAFAVSICKGITIKESLNKKSLIVGMWFGLFQGIMPLIGYFLIDSVAHHLDGVKSYVIFALLAYIGISMVVESFKKEDISDSLEFKEMLVLSIATSLDALSVGMTISLLEINVYSLNLVLYELFLIRLQAKSYVFAYLFPYQIFLHQNIPNIV